MFLSEILGLIPKYFREKVSKHNFYEFDGYDIIINFKAEPDDTVKSLIFCRITPNTGRHLWSKEVYSIYEFKEFHVL